MARHRRNYVSPHHNVGLLRTHGKQARRTAELVELLALAGSSTRQPDGRHVPAQNSLHRSVVMLMIQDYEAGASLIELSRRYNVRRNTVRDTLRRAGIDTGARAQHELLDNEQRASVRRLSEEGRSMRELAEMFSVSRWTISRALTQ